jgi:hypothetical protein
MVTRTVHGAALKRPGPRLSLIAGIALTLVLALVTWAAQGRSAPKAGPAKPVAPVSCTGPRTALVEDQSVRQTPALPEPEARVPFRDPVFGTCLVRLTDRRKDLPKGSTGGLKNEYSRVQSFNADESLILIRSTEARWLLYDSGSLKPLGMLLLEGSVDPRWDARDPDVLYYCDATRLMRLSVKSKAARVVRDFAKDFPGQSLAAVRTRYEGSPSDDGRYWGLMAQDTEWKTTAFLVYDAREDRIVSKRDLRGAPGMDEVDSVTMSPLGNYFLAQCRYCEEGQKGDSSRPCGLMVYDRDLKRGRNLLRVVGHSDTAVDAGGREVLVFQDNDTDFLSILDLETGKVTALWAIDFSHTPMGFHFSGRASRLPGWALVSTHDGDSKAWTWMDDQLFAMELKAKGRIVRLSHTRSLVDEQQEHDYWAEPQASVNRDFTRVLFTTNWGRSGTDQVETYLLVLNPGWTGAGAQATPAVKPTP